MFEAQQLAKKLAKESGGWLQTGPVQVLVGQTVQVDGRKLMYDIASVLSVGDVVAYVWDGQQGCVIAVVGQVDVL